MVEEVNSKSRYIPWNEYSKGLFGCLFLFILFSLCVCVLYLTERSYIPDANVQVREDPNDSNGVNINSTTGSGRLMVYNTELRTIQSSPILDLTTTGEVQNVADIVFADNVFSSSIETKVSAKSLVATVQNIEKQFDIMKTISNTTPTFDTVIINKGIIGATSNSRLMSIKGSLTNKDTGSSSDILSGSELTTTYLPINSNETRGFSNKCSIASDYATGTILRHNQLYQQIQVQNTTSGVTITDLCNIYLDSPTFTNTSTSLTCTNVYGIRIASPFTNTDSTSATTTYGIYLTMGSGSTNYGIWMNGSSGSTRSYMNAETMQIKTSSSSTPASIKLESNHSSGVSTMEFYRRLGSFSSPSVLTSSTTLGYFKWYAYTGSSPADTLMCSQEVNMSDVTSGAQTSIMIWKTMGLTPGTLTESLRIHSTGAVGINTSSPVANLHVTQSLTRGFQVGGTYSYSSGTPQSVLISPVFTPTAVSMSAYGMQITPTSTPSANFYVTSGIILTPSLSFASLASGSTVSRSDCITISPSILNNQASGSITVSAIYGIHMFTPSLGASASTTISASYGMYIESPGANGSATYTTTSCFTCVAGTGTNNYGVDISLGSGGSSVSTSGIRISASNITYNSSFVTKAIEVTGTFVPSAASVFSSAFYWTPSYQPASGATSNSVRSLNMISTFDTTNLGSGATSTGLYNQYMGWNINNLHDSGTTNISNVYGLYLPELSKTNSTNATAITTLYGIYLETPITNVGSFTCTNSYLINGIIGSATTNYGYFIGNASTVTNSGEINCTYLALDVSVPAANAICRLATYASNDTYQPELQLLKSRGNGTWKNMGVLTTGDTIGKITFQGTNDSSAAVTVAQIHSTMTTMTAGSEVGTLIFSTAAGAAVAEKGRFHTNGFFGVSTTTPAYEIDAGSGTVNAATLRYTSSLTNASDYRIKNQIMDLKLGLLELEQLQPKTYFFNNEYGSIDDKRVHCGLIAQELKTILPDAVKMEKVNGLDDFHSMDSAWILYTAVNAIKELSAKVKMLENLLVQMK